MGGESLGRVLPYKVRFPLSCSESPKTGGKLGIGGGSGDPVGDPFPQRTGYPVSVSIWFGLEGGDKILTRMGGESLGQVLPYKLAIFGADKVRVYSSPNSVVGLTGKVHMTMP
eukprot:scaffold1310_cov143-Amphora_coffeaeformis.AAC.1